MGVIGLKLTRLLLLVFFSKLADDEGDKGINGDNEDEGFFIVQQNYSFVTNLELEVGPNYLDCVSTQWWKLISIFIKLLYYFTALPPNKTMATPKTPQMIPKYTPRPPVPRFGLK